MPRDALDIDALGERFRFYFDGPGVLHIASHGVMPRDAIAAFFQAHSTVWDEQHLRFETMGETHTILWARHDHDGAVIIISCWERRSQYGTETN